MTSWIAVEVERSSVEPRLARKDSGYYYAIVGSNRDFTPSIHCPHNIGSYLGHRAAILIAVSGTRLTPVGIEEALILLTLLLANDLPSIRLFCTRAVISAILYATQSFAFTLPTSYLEQLLYLKQFSSSYRSFNVGGEEGSMATSTSPSAKKLRFSQSEASLSHSLHCITPLHITAFLRC